MARVIETFRYPLEKKFYPVGRSVVYIGQDFSVLCRVIAYDADQAILEPIEAKKPLVKA